MVRFTFSKDLSGLSVENRLCGGRGCQEGMWKYKEEAIAASKGERTTAWSVSADEGEWTRPKGI